jgi:ABC-type multidrug transport system fused ATPase/permease subunit
MTSPNPPPTEKSSAQRYRRLLQYLKPAKWPFIGGLLASLVFALASGLAFPVILQVVAPVLFTKPAATVTAAQPAGNTADSAIVVPLLTLTNTPATTNQVSPVASSETRAKDKTKTSQEWLIKWAKWFFGEDYRDKLLLTACLIMPLVFLIRGTASFLSRYWTNYAGFLMLEALRTDVFRRLQQLPLAFYQRHKSGDLTSAADD